MTRCKSLLPALVAAILALAPFAGDAVQPDEMLDDPRLEERAREISKDLRCLVCQNQSIDDSDAELARDLRVLVRERLQAGDSNRQIRDYVVARYGDFVLLDPPMKLSTYALWFGPAAIALGALLAALFYFRRGRRGASAAEATGPLQPTPLNEEERARVRRLLDEEDEPDGGRGDRSDRS